MALSMNECVRALNGGRRLHPNDLLALRDPREGLGGWFKKKKKRHYAAIAPQAEAEAKTRVNGAVSEMSALLSRARGVLNTIQTQIMQAEAATRASQDPGAFSLMQQISDTKFDVDSAVREAEGAFREFEGKLNTARAQGGNWAIPLVAASQAAVATIRTRLERAQRASSSVSSVFGRIQAQQQETAAAAQQQAAASQQAAAQQQAQIAAAAQRDRERVEREASMRREEREYEDRLEQQRLDRAAAIRSEAGAGRQAEAQFQQSLLQMEQSRADAELQFRREQAEREEEREVRREEQEAFIQQLLLMQELGIQPGMPGMPGPSQAPPGYPMRVPGYAQGPQVPGYAPGPRVPGFPGAMAQPGMPMSYPGAPGGFQQYQQPAYGPPAPPGLIPPGYPGYGAPAFPQTMAPFMAPYQQSSPLMAPMGPAPPGMEWTSFDPRGEMFGMGEHNTKASGVRRRPFGGNGLGLADQPVKNPLLKGGLVEAGYAIHGPSQDPKTKKKFFTFESPTGGSWTDWAERVIGPYAVPQKDPKTGRFIYSPVPGGKAAEDPFDWKDFQKDLQQMVGTGVQTYQQIAMTRAAEKAARQARRQGEAFDPSKYALSIPGGAAAGSKKLPGWAIGAGLGVVGLGIVMAIAKKKKE